MSTEAAETNAAPKKGKKKAKGKKMALQDFLGDTSSGTNFNKDPPKSTAPTNSWADSTDDIDPSEISTIWPEEKKMFDRSVLPSGPRASSAIQIDKSRLPSSPPYTVYLGNLSFECTEEDIVNFFQRKKILASSVRLPMESGTNRMRGFGYAEFDTLNDLMEALSLNKETLRNRPVSVDIAGGKSGDDYGGRGRREPMEDRTSGDWRRGGGQDEYDGPGRDSYDRESYRGSDRRYGGRGDYNRDGGRGRYGSGDYGGRDDYRSRDGGGRDYGGGRRDYGGSRDYGGGRDYDNRDRAYDRGAPRSRFGQNWQDDGPRDSYRDGPDSRYGDRDRRGHGGYDDRYGDRDHRGYGGGGYDGDRRGGYGGRDDHYRDRDRRGGGYGGRGRYGSRGSPEYQREEPVERPRIKLQPRSKPVDETSGSEGQSATIFGGAKPVDTTAREREIEEKLEKEKELAEKQSKELQEKPSVFGDAKPVDTATRERQIEERLAKENEQLERKLSESDRDKSPDRSGDQKASGDRRASGERRKTPELKEGSRNQQDESHDRRDDSNRGSRGGRRRHYSGGDDERRGPSGRRRGHHDDDGPPREREGDSRREEGRGDNDQRSSQERGDGDETRRRDDRRRGRGGGPRGGGDRRDDRKGYGDRGGRGRGRGGGRPREDRPRDDRRDDSRGGTRDRDNREKGTKPTTSAWSKGKPRSLGGVDPKKIVEDSEPVSFSQPSRYATLQDDAEDIGGSGEEGRRSPSPPAET